MRPSEIRVRGLFGVLLQGEAVMGRLVQVYMARNIPHAYLLKGALEASGIDAEVGNEELQMGLGPAFATAPIILVDESNAARAAEILKELYESAKPSEDAP